MLKKPQTRVYMAEETGVKTRTLTLKAFMTGVSRSELFQQSFSTVVTDHYK